VARRGLRRVDPAEAAAAIAAGALLVDIRSQLQCDRDGWVPGAVFIPRNVLEWRCDPACPSCDERLTDVDRQLIVMCNEGYQSSLAAARLQRLGFPTAWISAPTIAAATEDASPRRCTKATHRPAKRFPG
jgi:rhodanese-related sulfurtransferase